MISIRNTYSRRILAIVTAGTMLSMSGRFVLSPLLPTLTTNLSISSTQAGFALTMLWAATALSHYPGGRLSDELSRKTVLVVSLGFMAVATLALLATFHYAVFLVSVGLFGIGAGFYSPTAFAQLSDLFDSRLGQAFGINIAGVNTGGVVAAGLASAAIALGEWRLAFLPIFAVLVLTLLSQHRWNDQSYVITRTALNTRNTFRRLLGNAKIRSILLFAALFGFCWQSIISFLPTFLQVVKSTSSEFASLAFAGLFVMAVVLNPIAGKLGDRIGYPHVAALGCLLSMGGLAVLVSVSGTLLLAVGVLIIGTGLSLFWPTTNAYLMAAFPTGSRGGDFGAVRAVYIMFGSLGPTYTGYVADTFQFTASFVSLLFVFFLSLVTIGYTYTRHGA
jgi:MFS family permease